jgi:outer membrane protein OmpA-like peptidoglycan-associated protein
VIVRPTVFAPLMLCALAGCAQREQALFVVLPNSDGTSGAVTVSDSRQSVVLDQPYAAGEERGDKIAAATSSPEQIQQIFGSAIAVQPILPSHFRLYFKNDTDVLTTESEQQYRNVFDNIKRRPVYQVEVVGHTDTLGDQAYNQRLSLKRATAIREQLVRDGLNPQSISIAGRGQLDPIVPTADQTAEPRNRTVEITVR